jgi:AraC-like DNA-binding protein
MLDLMVNFTQDWDLEWTRMRPGEVTVTVAFYNTPRLQFSSVGYSKGIYIQGAPPKNSISITIIKTSECYAYHNQQLDPYELVVLREGEEIDYLSSASSVLFTLLVEEEFFLHAFFNYFGQTLQEIRAQQRLLIKEEYAKGFIAMMQQWLYYFKENPTPFSLEVYHSIENHMLESFFSLIYTQENYSVKKKFDIAKVREILHDNIDNVYKISDLVAEFEVSPRTIQQHFKNTLGYTPKQYLHQLRLNAIRKELVQGKPESIMISDIALKYGFFYPSHFGSEYKRVFGETPTQTLSN